VHKTGTAFTKPVDPLVGQAIEAWQALRPDQPKRLDRKTGEPVDLLFSIRAHPVAKNYINRSLIPSLCAKAGVPTADVRGNITSHRARSTIASQLYNAKEPMTLFELQAWLGHYVGDLVKWILLGSRRAVGDHGRGVPLGVVPHVPNDDVGELSLVALARLPLTLVLENLSCHVLLGRRVTTSLSDVDDVKDRVDRAVPAQVESMSSGWAVPFAGGDRDRRYSTPPCELCFAREPVRVSDLDEQVHRRHDTNTVQVGERGSELGE